MRRRQIFGTVGEDGTVTFFLFEIVGDLSWGHLGHIIRYPALVSTRSSGRVPGYRVPWNS